MAIGHGRPVGRVFSFFNPPAARSADNNVPGGWQCITASAVAVVAALACPSQATQFAVPAQVTPPSSATIIPLPYFAGAPRKTRVYYQSHFRPLAPITAAVVAPPQGWFGSVSSAARTATARPTQATQFAVPPSVAAQTPGQFGWYAPLSKAAPVAQAKPGSTFVPFNTVQIVISPQTVPLYQDAGSPQPRTAYYQALFNPLRPVTTASNTIAGIGWQSQPNVAVRSPAAVATLPTQFATPYQNTVVGLPWEAAWHRIAPPVPKHATINVSTLTFVVPPTQASNTITGIGWFQPLSKASPVAQGQQGSTSVPFNTTQITVAPAFGWYVPLSTARAVAQAQQGQSFVPLDTAQVQPAISIAWLMPLGTAAKGVSTAAQAGYSFTPLNTAQVQPAGISGMAWFQPLGTVAKSIPTAAQGISFTPLNTAQITPAVSPLPHNLQFHATVGRLKSF